MSRIQVRHSALVAFESGKTQAVTFKKVKEDRHRMSASEFVRVKGPGLIYFETETPLLAKARTSTSSSVTVPSLLHWGIM